MNNDCSRSGSRWFVIVCGVTLACGACAPANKEVGSACKNGVCPAALATDAPVCIVSALTAEVAISRSLDESGNPLETGELKLDKICLPDKVATDGQGKVQCRVRWERDRDDAHCEDYPFLTPVDWLPRVGGPEGDSPDTTPSCLLPQIGKPSDDAGTGVGWFYDEVPNEECLGMPGIYFVGAAQATVAASAPLTEQVIVWLSCEVGVQTIGADGGVEPSDGAMCTLPTNSAKHASSVGDSCQPRVPEGGFIEASNYVQTGATECGTGACLVFHLQGDPSLDCKETDSNSRCADPADVDDRVYCSCRCDGEGVPSSELCDCPHGFVCVEAMREGPEGIRGSYCARNGT